MPSYATEIKLSMLDRPHKRSCCRRMTAFGTLFFLQEVSCGIILPIPELVSPVSHMIKDQLGRHCEEIREARSHRTVLSFDAAALFDKKHLFFEGGALSVITPRPCQDCMAALIRGAFIACGHISPPHKGYSLELTPHQGLFTLHACLEAVGFSPSVGTRRGKQYLYIKKSGQIEDFFALLGETDIMFAFANEKIEREFRNSANRLASCESNNIARTVSAAGDQVDWIERLEAAGKLSMLPVELRETAKARLAHRDASLAHLAANMVPPLTKSGLNHRLQKIVAFAKSVLNETE